MRPKFYVLNGHETVPATLEEWAAFFEAADRHVSLTEIAPGVTVSTVFLGFDHSWGDDGPPILFETMLFDDYGGGDQWRYSTWAEAEAGHRKVVDEVRARLNDQVQQ